MFVRVGIAVTCSVAAFTLSQLKINKREVKGDVLSEVDEDSNREKRRQKGFEYDGDAPEEVPKTPEEEIKRVDPSPTRISSVKNVGGEVREGEGYLLPELESFFTGGLRSRDDLPGRSLSSSRTGLSPNLLLNQKRNEKIRVQDREYVEVLHRGNEQTHSETPSDGNPCGGQLFERHEEAEVPFGSGCAGTRSREVAGALSDNTLNPEPRGTETMACLGVRECRTERKLDYLELEVNPVDNQLTSVGFVDSEGSLDKYMQESNEVCCETVVEMLRNTIAELNEREIRLEGELLEYYGLQEREDEYFEMKRMFEEQTKTNEALRVRIEDLEAHAKGLASKLVGDGYMQQELFNARARILELQKQLHLESGESKTELLLLQQTKSSLEVRENELSMLKKKMSALEAREDEFLMLKQKMSALKAREDGVRRDFDLERKLQTLRELEVEVVELRRTNKDIQHQRRELTIQLSAAELQNAGLSNSNKNALIAQAEEKTAVLRQANEDLCRQVEGLQNSRFCEVEELVYLRWVNACLRYELRNFQAPGGKPTAMDLNKNLSPRSQATAKQLMLEHAGLCSKSQSESGYESTSSESSVPHESDGVGDNISDLSSDIGSGRIAKKPSLIRRLKKWTGRKEDKKGQKDGGSHDLSSCSSSFDRDRSCPTHHFQSEAESKGPLESLILRNRSRAVEITTYGSREVRDDSPVRSETSSDGMAVNFNLDTITKFRPNLPPIHTKPAEKELSEVAASFQLMSKSVIGSELDEKYPAFKDRHKAALEREKNIKERAALEREKTNKEKAAIEREIFIQEKAADETEECIQEKAADETEECIQEKAATTRKELIQEKATTEREEHTEEKAGQKPEQKASVTRYTGADLVLTNSSFLINLDAEFRPELSTVTNTRRVEITKRSCTVVEKKALRKAKPAPKRSSPGASVSTPIQVRKTAGGPTGLPPPPPPPPPPRTPGIPCPPPPPPTPGSISRGCGSEKMQRAPGVVEFYQSLMKRDAKSPGSAGGVSSNPEARNNMIGEIENRSTHLLAIKADVETQGQFVESLAAEVRGASFTDIEEVVEFVNWLDEELSFLVDERAVLKHFEWPEGKADALREASFEYRDLKKLQDEVSAFQDNPGLHCDAALKKILKCLEKMEQSVYALLRTRDMAIARYKDFSVPVQWMLDTGLVGKIKEAAVRLARFYMKRVSGELDHLAAGSEKEPLREFLLVQGVRFAFRVHQFAGGFDAESMAAFEALRNRAHMRDNSASQQESS